MCLGYRLDDVFFTIAEELDEVGGVCPAPTCCFCAQPCSIQSRFAAPSIPVTEMHMGTGVSLCC